MGAMRPSKRRSSRGTSAKFCGSKRCH